MKLILLPIVLVTLSAADVEKTVLEHLNSRFPVEDGEYVCDFSRLDLSRVPEFDSVSIDDYGKDIPRGQVVVRFSFFKNGERIYKTSGTVKVGILKQVLTAAVPIKAGEPLSPDKVIYQLRDISSVGDEPCHSEDQLSGKIAAKYIPSGRIITRSSVKFPPVISPGDRVEIHLKKGLLSLVTGGIARQAGALGDRVRVMNIDTRKTVYAQVADSATVVITDEEGM